MGFIKLNDYNSLQCGQCYRMTGTVNSIETGEPVFLGDGKIGLFLFDDVYSGDPLDFLQQLASAILIQEIEFSSTGAFDITFDLECFDFLTLQLAPNYIIWGADDIDIEIDTFEMTPSCQSEFCSECFELLPCGEGMLLIEASHDTDAFGLKYSGVGGSGNDFKQEMLVPGILEPLDYPYPVEEIFKFGDGDKKPILTDSEETHELITKMIPDYMHDALRLFLKHENLEINKKPAVKLEGTYTPEIDRTDNLASQVAVDIQLLKQDKYADRC